ncbi:MAG: MSMEG_0568 family radical SAM protein [Desulfobacterota bacterium]|nr:MSMEG_0568 family radical SAM protein [Thermodesulfobacteriota bacterium]
MNIKELCVDLQSCGVQMPNGSFGQRGGAGPAEGCTLIIRGHWCTVPTQSWYVGRSPYRILTEDDTIVLYRHNVPLCNVQLPPPPRFYRMHTPRGIPLEKIALMHGENCLASTVYQDCRYWATPHQCQFCGIGLSLQRGSTTLIKDPEDLALAAQVAALYDGARHVTLTTGAWRDEIHGAAHLAACVRTIKQSSRLPVHVQICPPKHLDVIDRLKHSGADTIGLHIDIPDETVRSRVAPGKAQVDYKIYHASWEYAVRVFGKNQVSSFLIAGLGETAEKMLTAIEHLCELGVFPYVVPLRPIPGTPLEHAQPPDADYMKALYHHTARILEKYGLSSQLSKAGCVCCGACSSLALFETTQQAKDRDESL